MSKNILLCHWNGRFGNRMHQYAYGATYSKLNNYIFWLPSDWEGTVLFKNQVHEVCPLDEIRLRINQRTEPFDNIDYRVKAIQDYWDKDARYINVDKPNENYNTFDGKNVFFDSVAAYHETVFQKMSKKYLNHIFEFSDLVKNCDNYKRLEDRQGTYDLAHLRRGEITNKEYNIKYQQNYSVISMYSYEKAFKKFDVDPQKVEWISDDYSRKWHKDRKLEVRGKWTYPVGSEELPVVIFDWLEDWLKIHFARKVFRANSSFSWWASFLNPNGKIFSPVLDDHCVFGIHGMREIQVDFIEATYPHWMHGKPDIYIND
jgi:hypothetical protein